MSTPPPSEPDQPAAGMGPADGTAPVSPAHRAPRPVPGETVRIPVGAGPAPTGDLTATRVDIPTGAPAAVSGTDESPTVAVPVHEPVHEPVHAPAQAPAPVTAPAPAQRWSQPEEYSQREAVEEPSIFPDAVPEPPRSRAAAHWWGVLISLTLTPVAWFLLADGSARIYWSLLEDPDALNLAGALGLAGGLLVLVGVLLAARWSSVGSIIAGLIAALGGLAFLAFPGQTIPWLEAQQATFEQFGGFGSNVYLYLVESGLRGHLLIGGVVLVFVGVVSHGARRQGRREARARFAYRASQGEDPLA